MLGNIKISGLQFGVLVMLYVVGTSILLVPSSFSQIVKFAKEDTWISIIAVTIIGLILVSFYDYMGRKFGNRTLVEMIEEVFGKWIGKSISSLWCAYTLLLASLVLRNLGDLMTTQVLADTPIQAILALFLATGIIGARSGLEVTGRTAEIFVPWVVFFFLILIFFNVPNVNGTNMQPMFHQDIRTLMYSMIPNIGSPYLELVVFLMIYPAVNQQKKATKGIYIGMLIGSFMILITTVMIILVFGPDTVERITFSSYVLGKKISLGRFVERIEVVVAILWILSAYVKMTVLLYVTAIGISKTTGSKSHQPLLLPIGLVIMALSIISYPDFAYFKTFFTNTWTPLAATFGIVLPVILVITAMIRGKWNKQNSNAG